MKINFIKNNRRPGYLLVESMINLIVCVLAIWTIITMTNFGSKSNRIDGDL